MTNNVLDLTNIPPTVLAQLREYSRIYTPYLLGATGDEDARRIVRAYYDDLLRVLRVAKLDKTPLYRQLFTLRRDAKYNGFTRRNSPSGIVQYYPDNNFIGGMVE